MLVPTHSVHRSTALRQVDDQLGKASLGGHVVLECLGKGRVSQRLGQALAQGLTRSGVVRQAEVALDNVFEQTNSKSVDKLMNHVAENGADSVEALIGLTDVCQAHVVQENALNNKDSNLERRKKYAEQICKETAVLHIHVINRWSNHKTYCLGQLASGLHDAETEGNDLGREQKSDHFSVVVLGKKGG